MEHRKRAKPNTPERYLWRKPGARHLWFRIAVPARFRDVEAKRIIQCSLGTLDRREASVKAAKLRAELHAEWETRLRGPSALSRDRDVPDEGALQRVATAAAYLRVQPKIEALWKQKAGADGAHTDFIGGLKQTREHYIATRESSTLAKWQSMADKEIRNNEWALPSDTKEYHSFVQMIAEAAIELLRVEIDRRMGNFDAEPKSPVVRNGLAAAESTAAYGETIPELFEHYAAQRLAEKRKRPDTVNQDRKIVLEFAAFVGLNRSVRSIAKSEVRQWRDCVAALPPGFRASKAYARLSLTDAAAKAKAAGAKPITPTTLNKYLSTVSPLLGWCVTNGYSDHNPCDGLFYATAKGKNRRPSMTPEQLKTIFTSPLFTGFSADGQEHVPGPEQCRDWRYWIPLLCLFTGARVGEIAQLRLADVGEENAISFLTIRHDERTGQQTKSARTRQIPVHSGLVSLGFLDFVEAERKRAADTANGQLFHSLSRDKRLQMGAEPSRFWRDYLKRIGIKSGRDGIGFHSFRHTLVDRLREAGYFNEEIAVAVGHSTKSVTSGYGRVEQGTVKRLSEMIENLSFTEVAHLNRDKISQIRLNPEYIQQQV